MRTDRRDQHEPQLHLWCPMLAYLTRQLFASMAHRIEALPVAAG
jgi:hypothetical protein